MKISELIGQLTILMVQHGDLPVTMGQVNTAGTEVRSVYADLGTFGEISPEIVIEPVDHW